MKKLVHSGCPVYFFRVLAILAMLNLTSGLQAQGCIMSCPPNSPPVQVSLSQACQDVITYAQLGVTATGCSGPITVEIFDNGFSLGNVITEAMIGGTFMVVVSNPSSGQFCMTTIMVVDKQAPTVMCPANVTLECTADLSEYSGLDDPGDIVDCSETQVYINDVLTSSGMCVNPIISRYMRTYIVVDEYNNATTCLQTISLAKADLDDVDFPPHLTGIDALSCFPAPNTTPAYTGYPSVNGGDILNGTFCNLSATKTDIVVALCTGGYKIFRTWIVYDWCDNNISIDSTQIIEVLDMTPPHVVAPADFTVSTGPSNCSANVIIPAATISEDCSTSWTVRMEGPFGTIHTNGGPVANLPVGVHRIIFKATNDCSIEGVDTMYITVQDLQPPTPICNQSLVIPVNHLGTSLIPASVFNAASYDNCGPVYFKVRRMTSPLGYSCPNPGNNNNLFDDFVQFCCADIAHNDIMVVLRVYDLPPVPGPVSNTYLLGHYNDCMVQVEVQDKLPPTIVCPSNLTISCVFPFTPQNLNVFGTVVLNPADREQICIDDPGVPGNPGLQCLGLDGLAQDNCSISVSSTASININNCGVGTIVRTFTATDDGGRQSSCQQTISVINYNLFGLSDITWPEDFTTNNICEIDLLDPEDLPAQYSEPGFTEGPCDLIGVTYEDDVYDFSNSDQACFKILRTWKIIDWCQYSPPAYGIWTHVQIIKVMNTVAPTIEPIDDISTCSFDVACGGLTLDFEATAEDDCSGPNSLSWRYSIDLDNNGSFDFVSAILTGETIEFSRYIPIGDHRIIYTVWDHCGNITSTEQNISLVSCKPPSAKCIHGLSTNLMPMDLTGDGIPDWGMVTLQAEMFDAGSDHPCGNEVTVAFSSDPNDVTRIFDCSDLGENEIELWAIDENGLTDFCITTVDIQDNNDVCPPQIGGTGNISGSITVPGAGKLAGAMVYLDGSNLSGIPSGQNGYYVFPAMPFGGQYTVRPERTGDAKNGVTTLDLVKIQKHLLGIQTFTTPFQFIAADVNNSQSITAIDIIQLRKLILGYYAELPNNTSWRFVDEVHVFPDPYNPWISPWPESYQIDPFSTNMNDVNFQAVKIGDLNLSANLHLGNGTIEPRGDKTCDIEYTITAQPEPNLFRIDLYLRDANSYTALQFSFQWDELGFEVVDWSPGDLLSNDDIRMPQQTGDGVSVIAYTTEKWINTRLPLLTMWLRQKPTGRLPLNLFLKSDPTAPVAYMSDTDTPIRIKLSATIDENRVVYNRPNPFKEMTTILYQSDRQEEAEIHFFDVNGRLILSRDIRLVVGENEFIVLQSELTGPGIYIYEINSDYQHSTNRMIMVD